MPQKPRKLSADLHGMGRLSIDAIIGITDIAESLHHTITNFSGDPDPGQQKRTKGIPGLVYRNIRATTSLVGDGLDVLLFQLDPLFAEKQSYRGREAALAVLNGLLGDHLVARNNSLAIPMQLRRDGKPLDEQALTAAIKQKNGRIAILVHGVCMNDLQWHRQGHDHGAALARDFGYTPIYVNYNSGLHISKNGRELSDLLETMSKLASRPLEVVIIAYSMGGLVARSACHYGESSGQTWLNHLQKLVFLGTPHHGAPLEKGGNWIDTIMGISPYSAPFSRLGKIRSSGFTDLRYGNVLDEDWQGRDRFEFAGDQRTPVPLPQGVACYAIAATTSNEPNMFTDSLIGDGLVPVSSALGRHKNPGLALSFPETQQWIGRNMTHLDLLNHPQVYATIKKWLGS